MPEPHVSAIAHSDRAKRTSKIMIPLRSRIAIRSTVLPPLRGSSISAFTPRARPIAS